MREDLNWGIGGQEYTSLNTRMASDQVMDSELTDISNFSFDELGALTKIGGNQVVFESSTNYTITGSEGVVVGTGAGNVTFTLPPANGNEDLVLWIGNMGTGIVTILPDGSEQIGTRFNKKLYGTGNFIRLISDNTNWLIMGKNFSDSGTIKMWSSATTPSGWQDCDDSAISRTTYDELFDTLSTTWGVGDGSTTYNVPELRGEFMRFWDDGRGVDAARVFASAQAASNAPHDHGGTTPHTHTNTTFPSITGGPGAFVGIAGTIGAVSTPTLFAPPWLTDSASGTIASDGTEGRPRNIALKAIIKL